MSITVTTKCSIFANSFLSGIRWTLSQLIMQRSNLGLSNPIDMIFHIQPFMILTLLPFIAVLEGPRIFNILTDSQVGVLMFAMLACRTKI